MATKDMTGKIAYMFDDNTSTWYAISGRVPTNAGYVWGGAHQFDNNVLLKGAITATLKFNSFLNPAARAAAITAPSTGLISFIQQDAVGNTVNKFQYWDGSAWVDLSSVSYSASSPSAANAGNVWIDSDNNQIYVYNGTAWTAVTSQAVERVDPFFLIGA